MDEYLLRAATNWSDGSEEDDAELIRELLDNESPFFMLPADIIDSSQTERSFSSEEQPTLMNRLVSKANVMYSGPTIGDIESALSFTNHHQQRTDESTDQSFFRNGFSILEKGLTKVDNKYTLKVRSCGDGMSDDGYKWRKYGQKSIKNSPNPR
ncbi:hypothetical protein MKW94_026363 [Papaver nudicaule]|uniref:WRKY domain-containing protein n=1 Tax=Papaver nudicaule TaxID=74823 RepID=A0AA41VPB6_PAPNU|nr:hypothetical protein [Papaver nudicaule]